MYYFSDKSFFCLLNYHNNSSTIPVAFIVKFWSTNTDMMPLGTVKEESFKDSLQRFDLELDAVFISIINQLC